MSREIKKPENFEDMLHLQAILDKNINSIRFRTLRDIGLSMVAEIIEFNEESKYSHKTWKTKEYNREKELEELTDIYFFLAQMVNFKMEHNDNYTECKDIISVIFENKPVFDENNDDNGFVDLLIFHSIQGQGIAIVRELIKITYYYGYTKDDILNSYWEKWQKNMSRIGKEWN